MNFDRLTQKLKESAAIAAEAAANFQGFDEMAANDDYVQSSEFNVTSPGGRRRTHGDRNNVQQQQFDDSSTLSTHSSLRASSTSRPMTQLPAAQHTPQQQQQQQQQQVVSSHPINAKNDFNPNYSKKRQLVPLKVSVPERTTQPLRANQTQEDDSLSRSSDDEDINDDPIISLLKQEKQERSQPSAPHSRKTNNNSDEGVGKHRFFQDLEERMSMPEQSGTRFETENNDVSSSIQQGPPSGDSSTLAVSNPLKTLFPRGLALPWKQASTTKDNAPRAPFFARSRAPPATASDPLSNVAVVSGAAMLSADELRQLDQAVQQQKQPPRPIRFGRRESFIAFTLVLAAFVYFFLSRNPTWTRSV